MAATSPPTTIAELHAYLASLDSTMLVEADGWLATHVPPRKVWGWVAIAEEIESSERSARTYQERKRDPLPVEYYNGRVWAYASALRAWMRRNSVTYEVHMRSLKRAKAAATTRTEGAREKRSALRVAG